MKFKISNVDKSIRFVAKRMTIFVWKKKTKKNLKKITGKEMQNKI